MPQTIEVEVGNLAALAHEQLQEIDDYGDVLSENVDEFILNLYKEVEEQSEETDLERSSS